MKILTSKYYELFIVVLAVLSIGMVVLDFSSIINLSKSPFVYIDNIILVIFAFDYVSRFVKADNKLRFFKANIFDLVAIIPFASIFSFFRLARIFRIARITRIARLSRLVGLIGKLTNRLNGFLETNGFRNVLYISLVLVLLSAATYSVAENAPFVDSLWWALVTTTTVGYGDISPATPFGRTAAIVLMFLGIGFIGLLTSTITEFFSKGSESKETEIEILTKKIDDLSKKIDELEKKL